MERLSKLLGIGTALIAMNGCSVPEQQQPAMKVIGPLTTIALDTKSDLKQALEKLGAEHAGIQESQEENGDIAVIECALSTIGNGEDIATRKTEDTFENYINENGLCNGRVSITSIATSKSSSTAGNLICVKHSFQNQIFCNERQVTVTFRSNNEN